MGGGIKQNLNLYWLAGTGLGIWALFVHAPPYLASLDEISPMLWIHIMGVYPIYMTCMHNTLITPSTFPWARDVHVWVGRVGLVLGVLGFVTGVILEWRRLDPDEFGNAIGVTVGGSVQMTAQFFGFRAIKRFQRFKRELAELKEAQKMETETSSNPTTTTTTTTRTAETEERIQKLEKQRDGALASHAYNMVGVFLLGCGIPALIRLPIGDDLEWLVFVLIGVSVVLFFLYGRVFERRIRHQTEANANKDEKKTIVLSKEEEAENPVMKQQEKTADKNDESVAAVLRGDTIRCSV